MTESTKVMITRNEKFVFNSSLSFTDTLSLVHQWGVDRNIIGGATLQAQYLKLVEEIGEVFVDIDFVDDEAIKDGIGDSIVVLTMMAGIAHLVVQEPKLPASYTERSSYTDDTFIGEFFYLLRTMAHSVARNDKDLLQVQLDRFMYLLDIKASKTYTTLNECFQLAYGEIKDRKGVLLDGVFIKEKDARYPAALEQLGKTA